MDPHSYITGIIDCFFGSVNRDYLFSRSFSLQNLKSFSFESLRVLNLIVTFNPSGLGRGQSPFTFLYSPSRVMAMVIGQVISE